MAWRPRATSPTNETNKQTKSTAWPAASGWKVVSCIKISQHDIDSEILVSHMRAWLSGTYQYNSSTVVSYHAIIDLDTAVVLAVAACIVATYFPLLPNLSRHAYYSVQSSRLLDIKGTARGLHTTTGKFARLQRRTWGPVHPCLLRGLFAGRVDYYSSCPVHRPTCCSTSDWRTDGRVTTIDSSTTTTVCILP